MEKISSIVPANARTKSVDVSRSQPVRPGAPTNGRPEGKVTKAIVDKVTLSSVAADRALPEKPMTYKQAAESQKAKVVSDLAEKFFGGQKALARGNDLTHSEEIAESMSDIESSIPAEASQSQPMRGSVLKQAISE